MQNAFLGWLDENINEIDLAAAPVDNITGRAKIYDLLVIETNSSKYQLVTKEYIVIFFNVILDNTDFSPVPGHGKKCVTKEEFDGITIDDQVEIQFSIYKISKYESVLFPVTLKCIEK